VYTNFRENATVIGSLLDGLKLDKSRGLYEAFAATLDVLAALHELDDPKWNKIKERLYVSFVKKGPTTNTSVSSGLAASVLKPGQSIGVLNCSTGPIRFQFYKMDEERAVRVLIDLTPPEEQEMYITNVLDPRKLAALREGIATTLDYLQTNDRVSVVALATGELREKWEKDLEADDGSLRAAWTLDLANLFQGLDVQAWCLLARIHRHARTLGSEYGHAHDCSQVGMSAAARAKSRVDTTADSIQFKSDCRICRVCEGTVPELLDRRQISYC